MQNTDLNSGLGGLRPRLASRFEPKAMPPGQGFEENFVEASGTLDASQQLSKKFAAQEGNQPAAQRDQPFPRGHVSEGSLVPPLPREKVAMSFSGEIENQTTQNRSEPIAMDHHLETGQVQSLHAFEKSVQFPDMHEEEKGNSQPAPLLSSPVITTRFVPVRTLEPYEHDDPTPVLHPYVTSMESDGQESINHRPQVVPQRIEITHMESQLPISNMQQLVPAMARLEHKSPVTIREPEPPPTINVTIGRIEVKATTPSPAPKRNASSTRTMSLEEYLQRRQGGQR